MIVKTVSKSAFKPHAFEYFRMVETGQTIVITDHGKPVARIVPYADAADWESSPWTLRSSSRSPRTIPAFAFTRSAPRSRGVRLSFRTYTQTLPTG